MSNYLQIACAKTYAQAALLKCFPDASGNSLTETIKIFLLVETWGKWGLSFCQKSPAFWKHTKTIDSNRENVFKSFDPRKNTMGL